MGGPAIWFGGGDRLSRVKDGKLSAITHENGLPDAAILAIVNDEDGNLWATGPGGLAVLGTNDHTNLFDTLLGH